MSEQPFVGRERELGQLEGFLGRALLGQGQVCFVTGEAGSGKTMLVQAFAQRAQDHDEHLAVASGNCNAQSGVGDPYLPFRELLAALIGVTGRAAEGGDPPAGSRLRHWLVRSTQVLIEVGPDLVGTIIPGGTLVAKAGKALAQKAGWLDELEKLARRKPGAQAPVQPEHLLEQYANVLRALAAERPLLLVLDDLHWADAASVGLLFHLSRRLETSAALLVGTYRPNELYLRAAAAGRHPLEPVLLEIKRYAGDVWVDLQTDEAGGRDFVNRLLDTEANRLGADFREALFRHTEGHALFTAELLRRLQERGDLIRDAQGCWVVGARLDFGALPSRVEGVIAQRIGHLDAAQQELLRVASVEGEAFTAEVVAQVQGLAPRQVLRDLAQDLAQRHALVQERGDLRAGRRQLSGYRFAHALFQHYLYGGLGSGERRLLHGEVAQAIEALYAGAPDPVRLAWHYDRAGDGERAAGFYREAGEQALRQGAPHEAEHLLTRALDLTPGPEAERRFELLLVREQARDLQGQRETQREDVEALESLAEGLDDGRRCQAALRRANHADLVSHFPAAMAAAERAAALAEKAGLPTRVAEAHLAWGRALYRHGARPQAKVHHELALQLAQAAGDRQTQADALRHLGQIALGADKRLAQDLYGQALGLYRQIGDLHGENIALRYLGVCAVNAQQDDRAAALLEEGLAGARRLGDRSGEAHASYALGALAQNQGRLADAEGPLQAALEAYRQTGERVQEAATLLILGSIRLEQDDFDQARAMFQAALRICRELGGTLHLSSVLKNLGILELALGNHHQARAYLEDAAEVARRAHNTVYEHHALCQLAYTELYGGNAAAALERARQGGDPGRFAEPWALLALGRLEEAEAALHSLLRDPQPLREWQRLAADLGLAAVALAKGDLRAALALVEGILPALGRSDLLDDVATAYLVCYEVLQACGDARAAGVLEGGWRQIERQTSRLDDAARERFIANMPSRRRLVAAWRAS
ncbi:ATP-binding protein [Deinococcus budaensis]|uniref:Putative ATPase n=1 Tax=Deinococcus budaensis TaxID=1665626 RepID=A0A7W8LRS0_9DEIO|nr:AAA family ATPase [Deinococcus budaensis]MBB5236193.1 putative ATPase [Deinococcus budaensis]